jgi:hypothetical protein
MTRTKDLKAVALSLASVVEELDELLRKERRSPGNRLPELLALLEDIARSDADRTETLVRLVKTLSRFGDVFSESLVTEGPPVTQSSSGELPGVIRIDPATPAECSDLNSLLSADPYPDLPELDIDAIARTCNAYTPTPAMLAEDWSDHVTKKG